MKDLKINIPPGYEIDREKSTFECIKFKKIKDNIKYIDLGLPSGTLWADRNVGAKNPEDCGQYLNFDDANSQYSCPTRTDIKELIENCNWLWVTYNKTNGYLVIGKNGNYIFLPASGYRYGSAGSLDNVGSYGYYWSASAIGSNCGYGLNFHSSSWYCNNYYQDYGFPIRTVKNL